MTIQHSLRRKSHFLGTKLRSLRKRNNLTLEDLSVRCVQMDPEAGPSVSYLSMIENGKPSAGTRMLFKVFAAMEFTAPKKCKSEHWPL